MVMVGRTICILTSTPPSSQIRGAPSLTRQWTLGIQVSSIPAAILLLAYSIPSQQIQRVMLNNAGLTCSVCLLQNMLESI